MAEFSYFWDGEVPGFGDLGPFDQSDLMDTFFRILTNGSGDRGVIPRWGGELAVSGTASPLTVASGAAMVYGMFYENTQPVAISIPIPSSGTRTDLIVARRSWTAQQVRIVRIEGPGAALIQTPLGLYDIPLASVVAEDTGVLTVTDTREWTNFTNYWEVQLLGVVGPCDGPLHMADGAVTAAKATDAFGCELREAGTMEPGAATPATWVAGAPYDYWRFPDAAFSSIWVYFLTPYNVVPGTWPDFYVHSAPHVNGAGAGAELCRWEWNIYYGPPYTGLATQTGFAQPDQQFRSNTNVYRDAIQANLPVYPGDLIAYNLLRNGAADSYNNPMRLLGIEMWWDSDA